MGSVEKSCVIRHFTFAPFDHFTLEKLNVRALQASQLTPHLAPGRDRTLLTGVI
ncbi:hypothetical protein VAE151_630738 [Vibrio aestuarianus]|nr:hypothetical protein VIBAE_B10822 [Vibrio aestuarianus subsp. francensis]CAH8229086.1 hypothetical protein VAE128_500731 [Vibrio aestuarianus]CAH8229099.1 hypothetical protein VAE032_330212 [Vibrio aestuarianus]CAH8229187.1 hypothetical protein VAE055_420739 [Vibrio aestuarianus]CAH8229612.1 hypothetical protein VAE115_380214 [Vibrio aestuarianus]